MLGTLAGVALSCSDSDCVHVVSSSGGRECVRGNASAAVRAQTYDELDAGESDQQMLLAASKSAILALPTNFLTFFMQRIRRCVGVICPPCLSACSAVVGDLPHTFMSIGSVCLPHMLVHQFAAMWHTYSRGLLYIIWQGFICGHLHTKQSVTTLTFANSLSERAYKGSGFQCSK